MSSTKLHHGDPPMLSSGVIDAHPNGLDTDWLDAPLWTRCFGAVQCSAIGSRAVRPRIDLTIDFRCDIDIIDEIRSKHQRVRPFLRAPSSTWAERYPPAGAWFWHSADRQS